MDDIESDVEIEEKDLITYYFYKGFQYKEICMFLLKRHGRQMSLRTLKKRVKIYGLQRNNVQYDVDELRNAIRRLIDGYGSFMGYRAVWHSLQLIGVRVPRYAVQLLLREIDPEGTEERKAHRLKRRIYHNPGPNYSWHCDGYDKLKPYGFPIHGCIDGWSRKILWLYVTRSNNQPSNVVTYYLDAVDEFGGCPLNLITDLGTENGAMAATHSFFRDDPDSHRYVPSPRNQRIESWWGSFRKACSTWWINFFKDMIDQKHLDTASEVQMECLWFCFSGVLQVTLNEIQEHWNTHYIRGSRHDTIKGRPESLYHISELHGAAGDYILPVPGNEMRYARNDIVEVIEEDIHQEYFRYVMSECNLQQPVNWREALELYLVLLGYADSN